MKHLSCPCRFYGILNQLGLYNKNAKILFLVSLERISTLRLLLFERLKLARISLLLCGAGP